MPKPTSNQPSAWSPQPGPQMAFLLCPFQEAFFNGGRGSGKSNALLGDWLKHAVKYGDKARGMLFRRTYTELEDLEAEAVRLYNAPAYCKFSKQDHEFEWPNGAVLKLKYLDNWQDAQRYYGWNTTWQGFDELTNWDTPKGIDLMWGSLRSAHGVPCQRRMTGMPGGAGTAWVRDRYIHGREPYVPFRYAPNPRRPDLTIEAVQIPATLEDNKKLLENDPGYEVRLAGIGDPDLYQAWRYGDWYVLVGRYYKAFDADRHTYDDALLSPWWYRWIAIDWGYAHDAAVLWAAFDGQRTWIYREYSRPGLTPTELARAIVDLTLGDEISAVYLGHDAFARRASERTYAMEMGDVFAAAGMPSPQRNDPDRLGALLVQQSFAANQVLISRKGCPKLIEKIPLAQRDEKDPEKVAKFEGDDLLDTLRTILTSKPHERALPPDVQAMQRVNAETAQGRFMQHRIAMSELNQPDYTSMRGSRRYVNA